MSNDLDTNGYTVAAFETSTQGRLPSSLVLMTLFIGAAVGGIIFSAAAYFNVVDMTWENVTLAAGVGMVSAFIVAKIAGNRSHWKFKKTMTDKINQGILELTGNSAQKLSVDQVQAVLEEKKTMPLEINGIGGIEVCVETLPSTYGDDTKAVAFRVAAHESGIDSFDHLVANAAKNHPDVEAVVNLYKQA